MTNVTEVTIILSVKHLSLGFLFSFVLGAYIGAIPEEVRLAARAFVFPVIQVLELCLKGNPGLPESQLQCVNPLKLWS